MMTIDQLIGALKKAKGENPEGGAMRVMLARELYSDAAKDIDPEDSGVRVLNETDVMFGHASTQDVRLGVHVLVLTP